MPDTFIGLALFAVFVSPGHAWQRVEERWRPRENRSGLSEIAEIVSTGGVFSLTASVLVMALAEWRPEAFLSLPALLEAPDMSAYVAGHLSPVTTTALTVLGIAHLLALLAAALWFGALGHMVRTRFSFVRTSRLNVGHTVWFDLFNAVDKEAQRVPLAITLDDGTLIEGFLKDYAADATVDDQVLALQGPIVVTTATGTRRRTRAQFAAVPGSQVRLLMGMVETRPASLQGRK